MKVKKFTTDKGTEVILQFVYDIERKKQNIRRSAWEVHAVRALINGKEAGYLKIAYIPREKGKEVFPDIIMFAARQRGYSFLTDSLREHAGPVDYAKLPIEELRELTKGITTYTIGSSFGHHEEVDRASENELRKLFKERVLLLKKRLGKDYIEFMNRFVNKPFVDFIRVEEDYQRKGVAILLYVSAAKWLATQGMRLYPGGPQSAEAVKAWEKMEERGWIKHDGKRRYIDANSI